MSRAYLDKTNYEFAAEIVKHISLVKQRVKIVAKNVYLKKENAIKIESHNSVSLLLFGMLLN